MDAATKSNDTQQPSVVVETSQRAIEVADLYLFLVEIILIFVAILVTVAKRRCRRRAATDLVDDDAPHSDLPTALETPAAAAGEGEETVHKGVRQAVAGRDFRVLRQHFERLHTADVRSEGKTPTQQDKSQTSVVQEDFVN